jgi:zinc D-Ala-D-Ala carboxypeptidase
MKLTPNFSLSELIESPTAKKLGIDNTPTAEHLANMKYVCEKILEPARAHFNKPVQVNSSYRCPELNKAIGGSTTSQHVNGQAVDFEIPGVSNKVLADWVSENVEYDQVILEFFNPAEGPNSGWVHASIKKEGGNRKQKLVASKDGTKTVYKPVTDFDPTNQYDQY